MSEALSTDFFASLEQCNPFPVPPLSRYDPLFPQIDPSSFLAQIDNPDLTTSSSSDNEAHSPQPTTPLPTLCPVSPPYQSNLKETPTIGTKRKSETPVTLPGTVVQELIRSQEEKKSRLARKAELARQSRRKKKMRLSDLETEVAELQGALAQAKEEIQRLTAKNLSLSTTPQTARETLDPLMDEILKWKGPSLMCSSPLLQPKKEAKTTSELKIEQLVPELMLAMQKETLATNCNLQALTQSLVPNMAIQFLEWTLTRGDHFYSEGTQFGHLFHETMQSTPQQLQAFLALRQAFKEDFKLKDNKVTEALDTVKQALTQRAHQVETFQKLRAIFTPQQLATYLQYVKMFGHVLVKVPA